MTIDEIKSTLLEFVKKYHIKKIVLFGSRADGTNKSDSDVDLIVEFFDPISLITLSQIRIDMEEALGLNVDLIHGPLSETDMIKANKEVVLYAA